MRSYKVHAGRRRHCLSKMTLTHHNRGESISRTTNGVWGRSKDLQERRKRCPFISVSAEQSDLQSPHKGRYILVSTPLPSWAIKEPGQT